MTVIDDVFCLDVLVTDDVINVKKFITRNLGQSPT